MPGQEASRTAPWLGHAHTARTLNLHDQRIDRVGQVGDLASAQGSAGLRQGVHLLAREPGLALRQVQRRLVQRHWKIGAGGARGFQHRLEIGGQQTLRGAGQGIDPVRLQPGHQPRALLIRTADTQAPHFATQRCKYGARALTALQPGVPGFVQGIVLKAGQLRPTHRRPPALGLHHDARQGASVVHPTSTGRRHGPG
jgi:hypothetical protein